MKNTVILRSVLLPVMLIALLVLITGCVPTGGSAPQDDMSSIYLIGFMIVIIALLYFTSSRSQRKQQKKQQELLSQLRKGDKVLTLSGVYGEIESTDDISAVLKIESGATIRVTKSSIAGKRS
jgi:preprotein translocase subunit YajC